MTSVVLSYLLYIDGSSSTQIKTETRTRVQGPSRTHHYTEESSSGRNRTTMPNDFDAPPERHHISKAMDDDLDRITCENGLHRALRGNNYDEIEEWIEKCDRYRKTPQTYELILEAYDKLVELRPGDAVKICNNKYKNLPFMGMKRYIKRVHHLACCCTAADRCLSRMG